MRARIAVACARGGRDPSEVLLIAVSKTVPSEVVRAAVEAGCTDFGENYVDELVEKAATVSGARWHFIGKLQSGTVRHVADLADVVHSLEPAAPLERLARRAAGRGRPIAGLIQVDFTGRRQGVAPDDLPAFADRTAALEGIRPVGLMTIPPPTADPEGARPYFRRLRELRDGLADRHGELRELSMGMSADFEIAIEEGATMVRVGTALFGERPAPGEGRDHAAGGGVGERA